MMEDKLGTVTPSVEGKKYIYFTGSELQPDSSGKKQKEVIWMGF